MARDRTGEEIEEFPEWDRRVIPRPVRARRPLAEPIPRQGTGNRLTNTELRQRTAALRATLQTPDETESSTTAA